MTSVLPAPIQDGDEAVAPPAFQSHGVVLLLDEVRFTFAHVSANATALLGRAPEGLLGGTLADILAPDDADHLVAQVREYGGTLGWHRVGLLSGGRAKVHGFAPAPGLIGLDLIPVTPEAESSGAQAIERVARWTEQLRETTQPGDLLALASELVCTLTRYDGTWACRMEDDGHGLVVAAYAVETANVVGQRVLATDMPPAQPELRGRPVPFFVADIAAATAALVPALPAGADFQGSTLLRPYATYLERLATIGVRSTLSVPLWLDGRLWGRLIAHDDEPHAVPPAIQAELRLLGDAVSTHLAELLRRADKQARAERSAWSSKLLGSIAARDDVLDGLANDPVSLLALCDATGALITLGDRSVTVGREADPLHDEVVLALARERLAQDLGTPLVATSAIDPGLDTGGIAGFLALRLGEELSDLVVWTRPEAQRTVAWVSHHPAEQDGPLFAAMTRRAEQQRGASDPWTPTQLQAVQDFRSSMADLLMTRYAQMSQMAADLARSNDEFDAFAHTAAHDLREPIRGIRQYTEFFLEDAAEKLDDEERQQVETVLRLADRMNGLLADLMRYAQLGQGIGAPTDVRLCAAVADALEVLPSELVATATVDVQETTITADATAVGQLLMNLLGNALKYGGERPHVAVGETTLEAVESAAAFPALDALPPGTPVLYVRDDGPGIAREYHGKIFELFRKLDPGATGSGAGLALCRRIAHRHGGEIWLESEPGLGATFYVALPPLVVRGPATA